MVRTYVRTVVIDIGVRSRGTAVSPRWPVRAGRAYGCCGGGERCPVLWWRQWRRSRWLGSHPRTTRERLCRRRLRKWKTRSPKVPVRCGGSGLGWSSTSTSGDRASPRRGGYCRFARNWRNCCPCAACGAAARWWYAGPPLCCSRCWPRPPPKAPGRQWWACPNSGCWPPPNWGSPYPDWPWCPDRARSSGPWSPPCSTASTWSPWPPRHRWSPQRRRSPQHRRRSGDRWAGNQENQLSGDRLVGDRRSGDRRPRVRPVRGSQARVRPVGVSQAGVSLVGVSLAGARPVRVKQVGARQVRATQVRVERGRVGRLGRRR
jgi:hypothetical protein